MADIAVIIPCYNNESFVAKAIESALNQEEVEAEVVVVDDGSTDGSVKIVQSYEPGVRLIQQSNQGACVARNRGLAETSAPFVKFLDADDYLLDSCLRKQIRDIHQLKAHQIVFGDARWVNQEGKLIAYSPDKPIPDGTILSVAQLIQSTPLTSSPLHRRPLLEAVGGFDAECLCSQEYDLHVRLALSGVEFVYKSVLTYNYVQHQGVDRISGCYAEVRVLQNKLRVLEKHVEATDEYFRGEIPQDVLRALGQSFWRHGRICVRSGVPELGRVCFMHGSKLAGKRAILGSLFYRILCNVIKPERLEV